MKNTEYFNSNSESSDKSSSFFQQAKEQWYSLTLLSKFFVCVLFLSSLIGGIISKDIDKESTAIIKSRQYLNKYNEIRQKYDSLSLPFLKIDSSHTQIQLTSDTIPNFQLLSSNNTIDSVTDTNMDSLTILNIKDTASYHKALDSIFFYSKRILGKKKDKVIPFIYKTNLEKFENIIKQIKSENDSVLVSSFSNFKRELESIQKDGQKVFEVKKREEYARKVSILFSLFFSCFAGLAFVFIDKNMNALIKGGKVYILNKEIDKSNQWLVWALVIWVVADIINLLKLNYGLKFSPIGEYAINSFISTFNSLFFILAMKDFDFKETPWWKKKKAYKLLFGVKKDGGKETMVYIFGIAIFVFVLEIFLAWVQPTTSGAIPVVYIQSPDFIFSLLTIVLLGFHLTTAFKERDKGEYNLLVIITLCLVFYMQITPFIKDFFLTQNVVIVIGALYRILLISLFLFLSFSWLYFFRGLKLDEKYNSVEKVRKELGHRLKGYLGNSIKHVEKLLDKDIRIKENEQKEIFRKILTEIRGNIAAHYNIHSFLEEEESNLYDFFSKFKNTYEKIYNTESFSMSIDEGLKKLSPTQDQIEEIGKFLNELVTNTSKHSKGKGWIQIEIDEIFKVGIRISIEDKNIYFDIEEAMKKTRHKKYSGLISIKERLDEVEGKIKNHMNSFKGNRIIIEYPLNINKDE